MVEELFRQDAYLKEADATVTALEERGVRLDRSIFYPTGGGQPGDTGVLRWDGGEAKIVDTVKADGGDVLHVLAPDAPRPAVGTKVQARARLGSALSPHAHAHGAACHVGRHQGQCHRRPGRRRQEPARLQPRRRSADQGMGDRGDQQAARRRPSGRAAMGHRRGAQCAARAGEDHERAPADGRRPRAAAGDRRRRPAGLRRHARRAHRPRSAASNAPRSRTRAR